MSQKIMLGHNATLVRGVLEKMLLGSLGVELRGLSYVDVKAMQEHQDLGLNSRVYFMVTFQ